MDDFYQQDQCEHRASLPWTWKHRALVILILLVLIATGLCLQRYGLAGVGWTILWLMPLPLFYAGIIVGYRRRWLMLLRSLLIAVVMFAMGQLRTPSWSDFSQDMRRASVLTIIWWCVPFVLGITMGYTIRVMETRRAESQRHPDDQALFSNEK